MRTGCGGLAVMFGLALVWLFAGFALMVAVGGYLQRGLAPDDPARVGLGQAAFAVGMGVALAGFTVCVALLRRRSAGGPPGSPPRPQATAPGRIPGGVIVQPNTLRADAPPLTDWSRSAQTTRYVPLPAEPSASQRAMPGPTLAQPRTGGGSRRAAAILCGCGGLGLVAALATSSLIAFALAVALAFAGGIAYGAAGDAPKPPINALRGGGWAIAPFAVVAVAAIASGTALAGPMLVALVIFYLGGAVAVEAGCLTHRLLTAGRRR